MTMTVEEVITAALQLKDSLEQDKQEYEERIAPKKAALRKAEMWLLKYLNEQGLQNAAVKGVGTAFKRKVTSVTVAQWEIIFSWIIENNRTDMLNHAVNKSVVTSYVESNGEPPPGVNYSSDIEISINRARAKADE